MKRCVSLLLSTAMAISFLQSGVFAEKNESIVSEYKTETMLAPDTSIENEDPKNTAELAVGAIIAFGKCGTDLTWELTSDGTLTISGAGDMNEYSIGNTPWIAHRSKIKKVIFGDNVTSVCSFAFCQSYTGYDYANLTSVDFGGVKIIGESAFRNCTGLKTIDFGEVDIIGNWAFFGCKALTSIDLAKVSTIRFGVFSDCTGLSKVELANVSAVWGKAFYKCTGLKNIHFRNVHSFGDEAFSGCTGLTSVDMAKVYVLENMVFENCTNLTSVDLSNVSSIGEAAFRNCSKLSYISIPISVNNIGKNAFYSCSNLKSVAVYNKDTVFTDNSIFSGCNSNLTLYGSKGSTCESYANTNSIQFKDIVYDSMKGSCGSKAYWELDDNGTLTINGKGGLTSWENYVSVPWHTFRNKIKTVNIEYGITYISQYAFPDCINLTEITIPDTIMQIDIDAFTGCSNLVINGNDGSYAEEYAKTNGIEFNYLNSLEHKNPIYASTYISFYPAGKGYGLAPIDYHEDYFERDANVYNHYLARMSMRLALASFSAKGDKAYQYTHLEEFFKKLEFRGFAFNEWYTKESEANSIAVGMAYKLLKDTVNNENYTLIAIGIRGGNYGSEWSGDFNVGNGKHHEGFEIASEKVIRFLNEYIENKEITGKIKIWISGYSRGAATANLVAAQLNKYKILLPSSVSLEQKDLFAYCFETPMTVKDPDNESGEYDNIFSIVNPNDFVPMIPLAEWGFQRYGITKYLPTAKFSGQAYPTLLNRMKGFFRDYTADTYEVDNFVNSGNASNLSQGEFLTLAMHAISKELKTTEDYVNLLQDPLERIGMDLTNNATALAENVMDEIGKNVLPIIFGGSFSIRTINGTIIVNNSYYALRKAVVKGMERTGLEPNPDVVDALVNVLSYLGRDNIKTLYDNIANRKSIIQGHYPEVCLAWLDATLEVELFEELDYRQLYLNCPVDLEVYDSNGNLVAAIYDDIPQKTDGSWLSAYVDDNGQKVVCLPSSDEYTLKVIATDEGEVTYTINEYKDGQVKVVSYENIPVSSNDVMVGTAEIAVDNTAEYPLEYNEEKQTANITEDAQPIRISIDGIGNGSTYGDGEYYIGQYVKASAVPLENEEFLGWYSGDVLVSEEQEFRFPVKESIELTAHFTENTCIVTFMNGQYCLDSVRIIKGETVTFPKITEKYNMLFDCFCKDEELAERASETDVYNADTILFASYTEPLESMGFEYIVSNDEIMIVGYNGTDSDIVIPKEIDSKAVTCIGDYSFSNCSSVNSVVIPGTVKSIGQNAFMNCINLSYIRITQSVVSIDDTAFENCEKVTVRLYDDSYAYEYVLNNSLNYEFLIPYSKLDFNEDGILTNTDIISFINGYLSNSTYKYDLDDNGRINIADLNTLMSILREKALE